MKKYSPSKRAAISIYFLLTVILVGMTILIFTLIAFIGHFVWLVEGIFWAVFAFVSCAMLPIYFKHSCITVTKNEIIQTSGMIFHKSEYMPMNSVKSVTTIRTPLGKYTGLNFIIINALGSKIILSFMRKSDCDEATEYINNIIATRA